MKKQRIVMGMPACISLPQGSEQEIDALFSYLDEVDARFSTYKAESEISRLNQGVLTREAISPQMKEVFALAEKTEAETNGYFSIHTPDGSIDPSGIVKGWAIQNVADGIEQSGYVNYYVEIGGDIACNGIDEDGNPWSIGIRSPFSYQDIVKVVYPNGRGIATSGTSARGQHIYNPHAPEAVIDDIASITVIGPDILEADRFATAAFAMGRDGILFLEQLPGVEAYLIDTNGVATMTSGFSKFTNAP